MEIIKVFSHFNGMQAFPYGHFICLILTILAKTVMRKGEKKLRRSGAERVIPGVRDDRTPGTTARSTPTHDNNVRHHHERYDRARRQGARHPHRSLNTRPLFRSGEGAARNIFARD